MIAAHEFPVGEGGAPAHITVSIGIATWPAMAENMDDLVARADAALYVAKRAGKDRVAICRPQPGLPMFKDSVAAAEA